MLALNLLLMAAPAADVLDPSSLPIQNLGFSVAIGDELVAAHGLVAFSVYEQDPGVDLNGDGDVFDRVVQVLDVGTGAVTNTGLTGVAKHFLDQYLVVHQTEAQLGQDLNGDGDLVDNNVLAVFDVLTGTSTNFGLTTTTLTFNFDGIAPAYAVPVEELRQGGVDLNGDGDDADTVLFVADLGAGTATNLGLAVSGLASSAEGIVFAVNEVIQGGLDLNGDGDASDRVLHFYDAATGTTVATPYAVSIADLGAHPGGRFTSLVREDDTGATDLNGDGDADDLVLHLHSFPGPTTTNLGVAVGQVEANDRLLAYGVRESQQGGIDLNGDGDTADSVLHVRDLASGTVQNLGIQLLFYPPLAVEGERVRATVSEAGQGATDLNGDGDTNDATLHVWTASTDALVNLGVAVSEAEIRGSRIVSEVYEFAQGAKLTVDDDINDSVLWSHDLATGVFGHTAVNAEKPALFGTLAMGLTSELAEYYLDLNGDGDGIDHVITVIDTTTGQSVSVPLAVDDIWYAMPAVITGGSMLVSVNEYSESADLNGDGDVADDVLHLIELPFRTGLTADADTIGLAAGGSQAFALESGRLHGGQLYALVGSASGTAPATSLGLVDLPLVLDAYTTATLTGPNSPPFTAFFGVLDALGRTDAPRIDVPAGTAPSLAGLHVDHAFAVLDLAAGAAAILASNPTGLTLIP